ncbi:unnamed protein product [Phytophthora lilii]|uniref:Unnamed protein product n=1 Tax=Phytophthora lilii TaxID=2077276 RepID=A0A9W6WLZ1_9STRA|nr:unnamed protein product [Phytophthora lilii]
MPPKLESKLPAGGLEDDDKQEDDEDQHEEDLQDQGPIALHHVEELEQLPVCSLDIRLTAQNESVDALVHARCSNVLQTATTYAMSMSSSMREMISPCSATIVAMRVYMPVICGIARAWQPEQLVYPQSSRLSYCNVPPRWCSPPEPHYYTSFERPHEFGTAAVASPRHFPAV